MNVLFFSSNCQYCIKFITELQKHPDIMKSFKLININSSNVKLPPFVRRIPTIIVNNNKRKLVLADTAAFKWLSNVTRETTNVIHDFGTNMLGSNITSSYASLDNDETLPSDTFFVDVRKDPKEYAIKTSAMKDNEISKNMDVLQKQRDMEIPSQQKRRDISFKRNTSEGQNNMTYDQVSSNRNRFGKQIRGHGPPKNAPDFNHPTSVSSTAYNNKLTESDFNKLTQRRTNIDIPKQEGKIDFTRSIY